MSLTFDSTMPSLSFLPHPTSIQILSITSESSWTLFVQKSDVYNSEGFFFPSQKEKMEE